ncbi:MAG TPA: hypothetical protein DEB57_10570 [Microbacterium sp.]|nr:hypothetical protein [Microbacterium sp.]
MRLDTRFDSTTGGASLRAPFGLASRTHAPEAVFSLLSDDVVAVTYRTLLDYPPSSFSIVETLPNAFAIACRSPRTWKLRLQLLHTLVLLP